MRKSFEIVALMLMLMVSGLGWAAGRIHGITTDEFARPIVGARVTVLECREGLVGNVIGAGKSETGGRFQIRCKFEQPSIRPKLVCITAETRDRIGFSTVINPDATQQVVLHKTGSITGVIKDIEGKGIQNVSIEPSAFMIPAFMSMRRMDYRWIRTAITIPESISDSHGMFTITGLPTGVETYLTARIDGMPIAKPKNWTEQWNDTLPAMPDSETNTRPIRITFIADPNPIPHGGIHGVVYDSSERPMSGVTVTVSRMQGDTLVQGEDLLSTISDAYGRYEFPRLKTGQYALTVFEADEPVPMETDIYVGDGYMSEVPLFAKKGVLVVGRVTDAKTGKGISGVIVFSPLTKPVVSGTDGGFSLNMLPGDGLIIANGESVGYYPKGTAITVPETGQLPDINITLSRYRTLTGKVIDPAGKPIDGAWIYTMWPDMPGDLHQAGSTGEYRLILDSRKSITLLASDYTLKYAGMKRVSLSGIDEKADIQLVRTASLRGTIVDQGGKTVANAKVTPMLAFAGYRLSLIDRVAHSNQDGQFEIEGLIPGAQYIIEIRAAGCKDQYVQPDELPKLTSGRTSTVRFILSEIEKNSK